MIRRLFMPKWKRELHERIAKLPPDFGANVERYVQGIEREARRMRVTA